MRISGNPEHAAAIQTGQRLAKLYRITDPLWQSIARGHSQETARLMSELAQLVARDKARQQDTKCPECNGKGKLTRLGGDWGKTPDTEVPCWRCAGAGKES